MRVAVIGCGMISDVYLDNMINRFDNLEVVACAAATMEHAEQKAKKYGIEARTVADIMDDETIELIVNLTPTHAHYGIIRQALLAGKHVFTEKALTETMEQGRELIALAKEKKCYLGCAPETFLGEATQVVKHMIEDGELGEITGFHASININMDIMYPIFRILTQPGAGIGLDRGVYFLTQLCYLLGEVADVKGYGRILGQDRDITPMGQQESVSIHLESENQLVAVLRMKSGVIGTLNLNGNTIFPELSHLEIQGKKGIVEIPDANHFGGTVRVLKEGTFDGKPEWRCIECDDTNLRGIGAAKMAEAIACGGENPVDAAMAYHVMEVFHKVVDHMGK